MNSEATLGGRAPTPVQRICVAATATRFAAMSYAGWGVDAGGRARARGKPGGRGVTVRVDADDVRGRAGDRPRRVAGGRGNRLGHAINAAGVSWAQLGTCVGTSYAWLPVGFVGPLLSALALSGTVVVLARWADGRQR